uniref:Uncharacterized protein n=1 Tax=Manihot esculenta TaxID=3983 RepID=A0A2C9U7S7_MANES
MTLFINFILLFILIFPVNLLRQFITKKTYSGQMESELS